MLIDEDIRKTEREARRKLLWVIGVPILILAFLIDGRYLLQTLEGTAGVMPKALAEALVEDIEYNYFYTEVFQTEEYQQMRTTLLARPVIFYRDFETYVLGFSDLAGDSFTYFYYDSLLEGRKDLTGMEAEDAVDGFEAFRKDGVPVIRFAQFGDETGDKVVQSIGDFHRRGDGTLIFDLTGNPGGRIDQCVQICDALLPEVAVFEERYNDRSRYQYVSDPEMMSFDHLIILLDEESASCSEIMALALKENLPDKVLLLGPGTYGKRVTQSVDQDDGMGYGLMLVTAQWFVNGKNVEDLNRHLGKPAAVTDAELDKGIRAAEALVHPSGE